MGHPILSMGHAILSMDFPIARKKLLNSAKPFSRMLLIRFQGFPMGNRLSKIYTRTGDQGTTGLGDGSRIPKDAIRIEAMGTVDELNSSVGILLAELEASDPLTSPLKWIQNDLFDLGGELSIPNYEIISESHVLRLESWLDELNTELPALKNFILPGGNKAAAACHLARSICRRAERTMVSLAHNEQVNQQGNIYLNRLSDLLFVCARILARRDGGQEVLWERTEPQR
jgi:cob(I)alamin adenosyltransferase